MKFLTIGIFAFGLVAWVAGCGSTGDPSTEACEGKSYCLAFVTAVAVANGDIDGTGDNDGSNGIEEADALCAADSNKPASGTYKAMIVDGANRVACTTANCGTGTGEHTDWVFYSDTEYRRTDETTVIGTTDSNGLLNFNLTNSFGGFALNHFTGLDTDWTGHANNCSSWTATGVNGRVGNQQGATTLAISSMNSACTDASRRLVCIEQ